MTCTIRSVSLGQSSDRPTLSSGLECHQAARHFESIRSFNVPSVLIRSCATSENAQPAVTCKCLLVDFLSAGVPILGCQQETGTEWTSRETSGLHRDLQGIKRTTTETHTVTGTCKCTLQYICTRHACHKDKGFRAHYCITKSIL